MSTGLGREDIRALLDDLSAELAARGARAELLLVGGAALAAKSWTRCSTKVHHEQGVADLMCVTIAHNANDNDTHCPPGSWKEPGMYEDEDNDGRFPNENPVENLYPRSKKEDMALCRDYCAGSVPAGPDRDRYGGRSPKTGVQPGGWSDRLVGLLAFIAGPDPGEPLCSLSSAAVDGGLDQREDRALQHRGQQDFPPAPPLIGRLRRAFPADELPDPLEDQPGEQPAYHASDLVHRLEQQLDYRLQLDHRLFPPAG